MFYVYEHWRPDKDLPFYVGKGHSRRANVMKDRNRHHKNKERSVVMVKNWANPEYRAKMMRSRNRSSFIKERG